MELVLLIAVLGMYFLGRKAPSSPAARWTLLILSAGWILLAILSGDGRLAIGCVFFALLGCAAWGISAWLLGRRLSAGRSSTGP